MIPRDGGKARPQGMALITVLLVVALAVTLATRMIDQQNLLIHRSVNQFDQSQALQYALGGEEIARQILFEDHQAKDKIDFLAEVWAQDIEPFEYPEGEVKIQISDMQACLNLNALILKGDLGDAMRQRMLNLLDVLAVDRMFMDRLIDYIDEDQEVRQLGAEDYEYLGLEVPYRTSSQPMVEASELRLIHELDRDVYEQLAPYVCVLPDSRTTINVNTASAEILQSLAPGLTAEMALELTDYRDYDEGFDDVAEFLRQLTAGGGPTVSTLGLSVDTRFFRVQIQARYNDRISRLTSLIQRDPTTGKLRVLARDLGRTILWRVDETAEDTAQRG